MKESQVFNRCREKKKKGAQRRRTNGAGGQPPGVLPGQLFGGFFIFKFNVKHFGKVGAQTM